MSAILIDEVQAWTREAGTMARSYFNNVTARRKADRSLVTQADLEIEAMLRTHITARHPDHGIIGEEQGGVAGDHEFVWCLDPIDGTGAFLSGLASWCISIGVLRHGEPYLGVILLPILGDCYWAEQGGLAFRNGEPISVVQADHVDSNDWLAVSSYAHRQFRIDFPGKTRGLSSVAADCCYVARGSAVGALIGRANLWDLAAGFAILRSAGAQVIGLSGTPVAVPALLETQRLPEPIIVAPPQLINTLRSQISRR
ncbi:MAG: inositol monophosphatase family protein [Oscillochloridaceae bacterium umkhey_bin13]